MDRSPLRFREFWYPVSRPMVRQVRYAKKMGAISAFICNQQKKTFREMDRRFIRSLRSFRHDDHDDWVAGNCLPSSGTARGTRATQNAMLFLRSFSLPFASSIPQERLPMRNYSLPSPLGGNRSRFTVTPLRRFVIRRD